MRALVLTDVVDSTKLAAELGAERNGALWAAHDRVARGLIGDRDGLELERTDGLLAAFSTVDAAVGFALDYHRALAALDPPLTARVGVHLGPVTVRENPAEHVARGAGRVEVDGLAVAVTSRVQSVAHGGQTLISGDARAALPALEARSCGWWHLKGAPEPLELFEVGPVGAPPADAAKAWRVFRDGDLWLPVRAVRHELPRERDAFVGRKADLQALAALLDGGSALVTVLGAGGTGKTRLVTRYAWSWLGEYPGGAWFCDLAEARDASGVLAAVGRALGVPLAGDAAALLGHAIAGRGRCLVILDNFEQVAREAASILGAWVDRCAEARFVVTSREVLGLRGESVLALDPLAPADGEALFVARARQAGGTLAEGDPAVAELVRLLDHLPLAIELAAARARVMPPKVLLERMSQRFRLLAGTGRQGRQATLRAALDWSWDLLPPAEQAGLAQLSVFEGFSLEGAEAVLDVGDAWPADVVQALVDKSLVRRRSDGRFDLLVSVQEYAAERLADGRAAAEARHGAWCATFGPEALEWADGPEAFAARDAARPELANLVAACKRAIARRDGPVAVATMAAAGRGLMAGNLDAAGPLAEGLLSLRAGLGPRDAVRAGRLAAMTLRTLGRGDTRALYDETIAAAREAGMRRDQASLLNGRAILELRAGRPEEAERMFREALEIDRADGFRAGQAMATMHLGVLETALQRHEAALAPYRESIGLYRAAGDRAGEAAGGSMLAGALVNLGRDAEAGPVFDRVLELQRAMASPRALGVTLTNLALQRFASDQPEAALPAADEAVVLNRQAGQRDVEATAQLVRSAVLGRTGRFDEARAAGDAALAILRELGDPGVLGVALGDVADVERRAGQLDRARALADQGLALLRGTGDLHGLGHTLATKVRIHTDSGDRPAAQAAWDELSAITASLELRPEANLARHVAAAERSLRRAG